MGALAMPSYHDDLQLMNLNITLGHPREHQENPGMFIILIPLICSFLILLEIPEKAEKAILADFKQTRQISSA